MKKIVLLVLFIFLSLFIISCTNKEIDKIIASNYVEFDINSVDLTKINLNVYYTNGKESKVKLSKDNFSTSDLNKLKIIGIHKVTVIYNNVETEMYIGITGSSFNVTICDGDTVLQNKMYTDKTKITYPDVNEKEGYIFSGFMTYDGKDIDTSVEIDSNALIFVKWEKKKFTINYYVGDELYKTSVASYGEEAPKVEDPYKDGYIFMGWNIEITGKLIYEDYNLTARFMRNDNKVTIRFFNGDDLICEENIEYGSSPSAVDTSGITGFTKWDTDINTQFFEDTDIHAIIEDEPLREEVKVIFNILDDILEYNIEKGTTISPDFSKYLEYYDITSLSYDINMPIEEDITIDVSLKIKLDVAFNYIKDDYHALLYGNGESKTIDTNFYDLYGFSGYTLKYNDYVLFVSNVYVITEEREDYIDDVPSPSTGTVYINKTDKALRVNLSQIRSNKKTGFNIVACNEKGYVTSIIDNDKSDSIIIPKNGFIWSPSYNDGTNSSLSLAISFRTLTNSDRLVLTNWTDKIDCIFQMQDGSLMGEYSVYPAYNMMYPETPNVGEYKFYMWDVNKNVFTDTIFTAIYIPINSKEVTLTVIGGTGSGTYHTGESVRIKADKKTNKEFSYWIMGGVKVSSDEEYDLVMTDDETVVAHYIDSYKLVNLKVEGNNIYYRNSTTNVLIPDALCDSLYGMRAAWVSVITDCVEKFKNEAQYKANIIDMLDVLNHYNFNAVMFHIRIYNDAYYPSVLNPRAYNMDTDLDMLSWTISECHKRGIEFHAWMNPYRVQSSGGTDLNAIANKIKSRCAANIGSDPQYLLGNSSGGVILNPGMPEVRDFLVQTCMEVVENFDVDAIHFDDYFYIDGVDDSKTREKYNKDNLSIQDFRRAQVDLFIEALSKAVRSYNKENGKFVQIGISPSGIWRNGNGVVTYDAYGNAISNGSNTKGMEHYAGYLFSDTVNWINHEWIDYIMPQTYWAFTHKTAPYADLLEWWDNIVKYKNVKLYSGIGIYMANGGGNYSWGTNTSELLQQLTYASKFENVSGVCLFKFQYVRQYYHNQANQYFKPMFDTLFKNNWKHPALLPEVTSANNPLTLGPVGGLNVTVDNEGNAKIQFSGIFDARKYVVFRTDGILDFSEEEIVSVVGERLGSVEVNDTLPYHGTFTYYVYAISGSNTLGVPKTFTVKY